MISESDLADFNPALKLLLRTELQAGNEVVETWRGWPRSTTIAISLKHHFMALQHMESSPHIAFRLMNDPHYWYAEFEDTETGHLLVCRY